MQNNIYEEIFFKFRNSPLEKQMWGATLSGW